jgi:hypothetical protein
MTALFFRRPIVRFHCAFLAAITLTVWYLANKSEVEANPQRAVQIDRIVGRCTEDMVRQTCTVMTNPSGEAVAEGTVIFVAGVGAIEASTYNQLRADGASMCETVRKGCNENWSGSACSTARALYGDT